MKGRGERYYCLWCSKKGADRTVPATPMSKRSSSIARRVLFTIAIAAVRRNKKGEPINPVIREYYDKKLISKAKKSAIGAIMRKITNIIFAVLRDNKEYEMRTPQQHIEKYNVITFKLVA